jgi:YVTN family beta-propeller protein
MLILLVSFGGIYPSYSQFDPIESSSLGDVRPINLAKPLIARALNALELAPAGVDTVPNLEEVLNRFPSPIVQLFVPGLGKGSGTIIHPAGIILTNFHVIGDRVRSWQTGRAVVADSIFVAVTERLGEPTVVRFQAGYVVGDPLFDLAILRLIGRAELTDEGIRTGPLPAGLTFPFVGLGDSDALSLGDELTIVGYPEGFDLTVTRGIVTGVKNFEGKRVNIMTDARLSSGNSGGAALAADGRLAGVPSAIFRLAQCDLVAPRIANNIWIGREPTGIDVDLDGRFIYAANFDRVGSISVIDVRTNVEVKRISIRGAFPFDVKVSPNGKFVYISNRGSNNVSVITTEDHRIAGTIAVGEGPWGIGFSPDSRLAYIANTDGNSISIVDTSRLEVIRTVTGIPSPTAVTVSPEGRLLYVASRDVIVLNAGSLRVIDTIDVEDFPYDLAIDPKGDFVYASINPPGTATPGHVAVISTFTHEVYTTIPVGKDPLGIDVSPGGRFVFVANFFQTGGVSVIDTRPFEVIFTIADALLGTELFDVAVTPDGNRVYATSKSNNVVVIETNLRTNAPGAC